MKRILLLVVSVLALGATTKAQNSKVVTAARANGTYRNRGSEVRILALGNHKLKVQFDLAYEYKSPQGPTANLGYASGAATIEGNVATFVPPDTQGCKITMTFLPGRLKVTQEGSDADCGFGHHVYATGTYRRIRGGKPKFEAVP